MTTKQTHLKTTANPSSLDRHARKCKICNHKDREDIELDFLHWNSCYAISVGYDLDSARVIYRHAHATGLYDRRMLNLKFAAAHIVDHAESVTPSSAAVLKAIQACSQINSQGEWIETPRRIIHQVEHHHVSAATSPQLTERSAAPVSADEPSETEISNRHWMRLENAATPTKQ
jgi:hypothetical protein